MKRFFSKKVVWKAGQQILFYLGLCGLILALSLYLQPGPVASVLKNLIHEPRLLLLNLFPVAAILGLLWAAFGNLLDGAAVTNLVINLLSLVNLIKTDCRKDPLVPDDFALLGEAMVATGEYQLNLHIPLLLLILALSLVLVLLGRRYKTPGKLWGRLAAGLLAIALFAGAMGTVYPSQDLYKEMASSVEGLSTSNVPAVFEETGFLYCFLHNVNLYAVTKPQGYDREEVERWESRTAQAPAEGPLPVNVIFIQCEAFTDLYDGPAFAYSPEKNPAYLYHQVADSDQAISGHIVVSNFGAGTANTEFDVLTGVETNMLNEVVTSAFRTVHKKMASLCRVYRSQGYTSWFMHPGQRWFYNRESVYDRMGFEESTFVDAFTAHGNLLYKGGYFSDEAFGQMLIAQYRAHRASETCPWFAFTVTIQNHQAYPYRKYPNLELPAPPLNLEVSDAAAEALTVYAEGIRDSSLLLANLADFFDGEETPTLLIFWGDHLPALGNGFQIYQELGLGIGNEEDPASALETYQTPFTIWANRSYCDRYDLAARVEALDLPAGNRISDVYLGELVYELTNMTGTDAYFDYLAQARRTLPVISRGTYQLPDGTLTRSLTPEQQQVVDTLYRWGYYRTVEQKIDE